MKPTYISIFHVPPCLPAETPTSGRRIESVFSHNTDYQCTNTDLLFQLRFFPLRHGESFYPSLLPFLFNWCKKGWEITEEILINCTAYTYYVMLMTKYTWTWLHHPLKLLPSTMFLPCTDLGQPGWFHDEAYMHVLWLWFANTSATKIIIKHVGW